MREPSLMQKLFCHELLTDPKKNVTQAAIRAGYSEKTASVIGSRLKHHKDHANVQEYLSKLLKKHTAKLDITARKVLRNIDEISENCLGHTDVCDKDGKVINKTEFNPTGALGANKLLGLNLKLFSDDEGRDTNVTVTVMPQITVKGKPFKPKIGKQ